MAGQEPRRERRPNPAYVTYQERAAGKGSVAGGYYDSHGKFIITDPAAFFAAKRDYSAVVPEVIEMEMVVENGIEVWQAVENDFFS